MDDIIVLATCLVSSDTVVNRNRGIERPTSAGDRDLIARINMPVPTDAGYDSVLL
jgi:hypothetical protein